MTFRSERPTSIALAKALAATIARPDAAAAAAVALCLLALHSSHAIPAVAGALAVVLLGLTLPGGMLLHALSYGVLRLVIHGDVALPLDGYPGLTPDETADAYERELLWGLHAIGIGTLIALTIAVILGRIPRATIPLHRPTPEDPTLPYALAAEHAARDGALASWTPPRRREPTGAAALPAHGGGVAPTLDTATATIATGAAIAVLFAAGHQLHGPAPTDVEPIAIDVAAVDLRPPGTRSTIRTTDGTMHPIDTSTARLARPGDRLNCVRTQPTLRVPEAPRPLARCRPREDPTR